MVARLSGPSTIFRHSLAPAVSYAGRRCLVTDNTVLDNCFRHFRRFPIRPKESLCCHCSLPIMFRHLWRMSDCLITQLVPGSQEVSRLSASPFRCRRRNGRRFRLLPWLLTGERPRVGAFGPNSATIRYRHCGQALLEGAQRYLFCSRMASLQRRPRVMTGR